MGYRHTISTRLGYPIRAKELGEFLAGAPDDALVTVVVHEGGSQRDPHPIETTFVADWESE